MILIASGLGSTHWLEIISSITHQLTNRNCAFSYILVLLEKVQRGGAQTPTTLVHCSIQGRFWGYVIPGAVSVHRRMSAQVRPTQHNDSNQAKSELNYKTGRNCLLSVLSGGYLSSLTPIGGSDDWCLASCFTVVAWFCSLLHAACS